MKYWGGTLLLFVLSISQFSLAQDMSPVEIYSRCYSRLSDYPVETDSADYKAVEKGTLDPIDGCKKLFNRATFEVTGTVKKLKNENDVIAQSILRNFNQFHFSWFTSLGGSVSALGLTTYNFADATEPALFITDSLFSDEHFKTIFTRNTSLRGIRKGDTATNFYTLDRTEYSNRDILSGPFSGSQNNISAGSFSVVDMEKVPTGYLIGVERPPAVNVRLRLGYYKDTIATADLTSNREDTPNINLTQNYGGGILGSQPYIIANSEADNRPDGGNRVYRRLANNTYSDLMCLTLPTLLNSDVDDYMTKYDKSDLSFRKDRSCARCHATLDPFAHSLRNFSPIATTTNTYRDLLRKNGHPGALQLISYRKYKARVSEQSVADADNIYIRRTPKGHLYYRDYDGNLVDEQVTGSTQLAQKMTEQNDIYVCAAQRYYKFLTGISVPVANQTGTPFYLKHREKVIELGLALKDHGSLKTLIFDILETPAFKTRNPALDLEQGAQ